MLVQVQSTALNNPFLFKKLGREGFFFFILPLEFMNESTQKSTHLMEKGKMKGTFTLTRLNGIWQYYTYDENGKRRKYSTGLNKKSAAYAYCLSLAQQGALIPSRKEKLTFREFAEPFWIWGKCPIVTDKILRGYKFSQTLCRNNRHCMRKNILPTFGDCLLTDITPDMVNRWLLGLIKPRTVDGKRYPPLANSTANKMLRILREMLDVAVQQGLLATNPAKSVHKLADNYKRRGCFTLDEARLILNDREAWRSPLAWLGSYTAAMTGMREGEIRALKSGDIKGDHILVQHSFDVTVGVKSTKADKPRHVPIPPALRSALLFYAPKRGFIFSLDGGEHPVNPDHLLDNLYYRMKDLGIDYKRKRLCFHSWRHFFNTRLIAGGVTGEITRAVVGHESEDMTDRYLHLSAEDLEKVKRIQSTLLN